MPPSSFRGSSARYVRPRKRSALTLGDLPDRGFTEAQVETVKEYVESGEVTRASLTYFGKGFVKVAPAFGLTILTLRDRLAASRRDIVETCTFRLEAIDPEKDKALGLLDYLAAQPVQARVSDDERDAFKAHIEHELKALLPIPKQREGFTREQIALIQKIIQGLAVGGNGVAPLMGFAREPSVAARLEVMNLKIVGKFEYKLEKVEG